MIELSVIYQFIVIFLLPLIPAALLFWKIPTRHVDSSIEGVFFGFSIKAGGSAALYCILTFLAAFVYNNVLDQGKRLVEGAITITLEGDPDDIQKYFLSTSGRIALQFQDSNQLIASARGFIPDPEKNIINSESFIFEQQYEGRNVSITFTPGRKNLKLTKIPEKLSRNMTMTLTVSPTSGGDFVAPVDLEELKFGNYGKSLSIRHAIILENITSNNLSSVLFVPIEVEGISKAKFSIKRISKSDRDAIFASWSREKVGNLDASELAKNLSASITAASKAGAIIDSDVLTSEEIDHLRVQKFRDPNKVARFMAGVTPRVDFGGSGIKSGESILIEIQVERDDLPPNVKFKLDPDPERIGRRYLYPTQRAVMTVHCDDTLQLSDLIGDIDYQSSDGRTDKFGDARVKRSTASKALALDMEAVQRNSFLLMPIYWKEVKNDSAPH